MWPENMTGYQVTNYKQMVRSVHKNAGHTKIHIRYETGTADRKLYSFCMLIYLWT